MSGCFISAADLFGVCAISRVREADIQGLIDEQHVSEEIPAVSERFGFSILDSDGSHLGEGTELRAASGSTL
jgi:hypothetical protein